MARDAAQSASAQRMDATDWQGKAGQGAMAGAMFGPQGAAIGAGIGGLLGLAGAVKTRHDEGQGWLKAIGRSLFDMKPLISGHAIPGVLQGMAGTAMALNGAKARGEGQTAPSGYQGIDSPDQLVGQDWADYGNMGRGTSAMPSSFAAVDEFAPNALSGPFVKPGGGNRF